MNKCHLCDEPAYKEGVDETESPIALCESCCVCMNCRTQEFEEITSDLWKLTKTPVRPGGWIFQDPSTFQTVCYYELYCSCCRDLWCATCLCLTCTRRCDECCAPCSDPCDCSNRTNLAETIPLVLHTTPEVAETLHDPLLSIHPHRNSSHDSLHLPMRDSGPETLPQTRNTSPVH